MVWRKPSFTSVTAAFYANRHDFASLVVECGENDETVNVLGSDVFYLTLNENRPPAISCELCEIISNPD